MDLRTCSILRGIWRVAKWSDNNFVIYDTYFPFVMTLNFTNVHCDLCYFINASYAASQTDKLQIQHITTDKDYKFVYKATYLFDVCK